MPVDPEQDKGVGGLNILFELKIVPLVGIEGGTTKPGGRPPYT